MVRPLLESCSLQTLAQIESLDPILGGALISSSEFKCIDTECRPLSFIYRYSSTTLEVRDILQTESVYASLTIQDLPTKDRHQLAIEYAVHGVFGDTVCIFLVARHSQTSLPELFVFDPWNLRCSIIISSYCSNDRVSSMGLSPKIHFQGDRQPNNATTSGNFFQLLVIGTEIGSVHILQLCPDNIQNSLSIPYAMIKCKCHYVASIALQIAMLDSESHSDVSAYIFIGGFNGEIEVISYGQLPDENDGAFGMQSTKVITTLWKNMAVTTLEIRSLSGKSDAVLIAGQSFQKNLQLRSECHRPSITMLKLKLPSLKSMEIWKEECKDPSGAIDESEGYESTKVVSLDIFDSKTDKKLKVYSVSSFQRKDESHEVVFSEWNVTANVDSVRPSRHHVITWVSHLLDAAVVSCFGQIIVLEACQLHTAYTSIVEPSKVEFSDIKSSYDIVSVANKVKQKLSQYSKKVAASYSSRRRTTGPLIIDKLLVQEGFDDQYAPSEDSSELYSKYISAQSDLSHLRSSRALLYILLDALGESEFQKFAENIDLDISTRHLVTDCWAIDHLKIDILHAMDRPTYMIPFPSNYLRAVKDNAGVPAALKLIKANHIRVDDITDEEVIAAYLPTLDPIDAVMALKTVGKLLAKSNKLESVLKKLVSHWFKEENRKQMTTKLMSTTVEAMLEQEVITYCSSTKPSWPNLHFLFSYYLNRNYYVEAMAVHEMLIQQDATSVVEQQRKVITDSALKLIPSIQKALSSISVDKNATVEAIPFSSLVFTHNLQSSDHEEDEPLVEQLIQQIQLLNPSNPHSNPFARPPKMAYN